MIVRHAARYGGIQSSKARRACGQQKTTLTLAASAQRHFFDQPSTPTFIRMLTVSVSDSNLSRVETPHGLEYGMNGY
jgi:hypothetical protein